VPRKWNLELVNIFVVEKSNCELLSEKYVRTLGNLSFRCVCGNEFETTWKQFSSESIKKRQCNGCGIKQSNAGRTYTLRSVSDFVSQYGVTVLNKVYTNCKTEMDFKCVCGNEFRSKFDAFKNGGRKYCFECQSIEGNLFVKGIKAHNKKSKETFLGELKGLHNGDYKLISEYKDVKSKIKLLHFCGFVWNTTPDHVLNHNNECPECFDVKNSKLSRRIQKWLENNHFAFKKEFRFKDCVHERTLPFDFAVFVSGELKHLIEADGEQHFIPYRFLKDEVKRKEHFGLTQKRDAIKNDYCSKNDIKLIRIPYFEFDRVEEILNENMLIPSQASESK